MNATILKPVTAIVILFLIVVGGFTYYQKSRPQSVPDFTQSARLQNAQETNVVSWIDSLQYKDQTQPSFGAITVSSGVSVYEQGTNTPLRRVIPYFTHLGVMGVLDTNDSRKLEIARKWLIWYLDHIDATAGVPLDTWYSMDGVYGTTCPVSGDALQCNYVDAEDSSAALFFVVAEKYLMTGGDASVLTSRVSQVQRVAQTIAALTDSSDGLTWAKATYPIKYMMDNAEVYAGLASLSRINTQYFGGSVGTTNYTAAADAIRTTLNSSAPSGMLNTNGTFYVYKDGSGNRATANLSTWYPDKMAQLWPYAFGAATAQAPYTSAHEQLSVNDCTVLRALTGDADEPSISYVMYTQSDPRASALARCMYIANSSFEWPFHVGQAGWLLRRE